MKKAKANSGWKRQWWEIELYKRVRTKPWHIGRKRFYVYAGSYNTAFHKIKQQYPHAKLLMARTLFS